MATGIYQIRNLINGKRYIGSAAGKGFRNRWNHHLKTLKDGRKTTPGQDIEICQRIQNGEKQKDLALEFSVDPSVISCIKRGVKRYGI